MSKHENNVEKLIEEIANIVKKQEGWKNTIEGNNKLQEKVYQLLNEVCHVYTERIEK